MNVMTPAHPPGTVPRQLTGFLLRRAYVASRASAEACIEEDVDLREFPAMALLGALGSMSQTKLGELMHRDRTTIGKLVDGLADKGYVVRERDAKDRRSNTLRLTGDGLTALATLRRALDRGESTLISRLTTTERARLASELRRLLAEDATLDVESLGDRCGYLIARAHRVMAHRATEALEPLGLTPRDFGVLSVLGGAQPCSQQQLASMLGVSAPAVLGFVDELEASGLVERKRNADDRRAYDLTLTGAGAIRLEAAQAVASDLQSGIEQTLGEDVDRDLRRLLTKVIDGPAERADHPAGRADHPAGRADHPAEPADHPAVRADHPAVRADHPGVRADHPAVRADHPAVRADHPAGRADHPAERADHPAVRADHPAGRADHPGERADHPAGRADHPAVRADHPAGRADHPAEAASDPVDLAMS